MKTKKKAKPLRPRKKVTRDPISRALQVTEKKYEAAVMEFNKCIAKIVTLKDEIPTLADRIRVLGGRATDMPVVLGTLPAPPAAAAPEGADATDIAQARVILQHPLSERIPTGPPPANVMAAIPNAIRHMIKEHPAAVKDNFGARGFVERVDLTQPDPNE